MVDGGSTIDGVARGQRASGCRSVGRGRPAAIADAASSEICSVSRDEYEGQLAGESRVGDIPLRQFDYIGIDRLHVHETRGEAPRVAPAAEHENVAVRDVVRGFGSFWIAEEMFNGCDFELVLERNVGQRDAARR